MRRNYIIIIFIYNLIIVIVINLSQLINKFKNNVIINFYLNLLIKISFYFVNKNDHIKLNY